MYFLVEIRNSKERIKVPLKWIQNLDLSMIFNYGVRYQKNIIYTIFACADKSAEPDFRLTKLNRLDLQRPACYQAKILKCSGILFSTPYLLTKNRHWFLREIWRWCKRWSKSWWKPEWKSRRFQRFRCWRNPKLAAKQWQRHSIVWRGIATSKKIINRLINKIWTWCNMM